MRANKIFMKLQYQMLMFELRVYLYIAGETEDRVYVTICFHSVLFGVMLIIQYRL